MTATSAQARSDHERSGTATANRAIVLAYVRAVRGQTAVELYERAKRLGTSLTRHEFSRRLPELRKAGLVKNGNARQCRKNGTRQMTWYAVSLALNVRTGSISS
jgi:hypothetical protein